MLKNILKLDGVNELSKKQQEATLGGGFTRCSSDQDCAHLCGKCVGWGVCLHPVNGCA